MRKFYLLVLSIFNIAIGWSTVFQPVEIYSIRNGLSHSVITCQHIDQYGFLWIGTNDGLNRFDGYNFRIYQANPEDTNSIANDHIIALKEGVNGQLLVCTSTGVSKYNVASDNFSSVFLLQNPVGSTTISTLQDIDVDITSGDLYVLSDDFITKINFAGKTRQVLELSKRNISGMNTLKLLSGNKGMLIANKQMVIFYNEQTNEIKEIFNLDAFETTNNNGIKGLVILDKATQLVYTEDLIWEIQFSDNQCYIEKIPLGFPSESLIFSIQKSQNGIVNVLTSEGILEFDIHSSQKIQFNPLNYLSGKGVYISDFLLDQNNVLWLASSEGLLKYNLHGNNFKNLILPDFIKGNKSVKAVAIDKNGMIWVGLNNRELLIIDPAIEAPGNPVIARRQFSVELNSLTRNANNDILLSTSSGLYVFKPESLNFYKSGLNESSIFLKNSYIYVASADELFTTLIATRDGIFEINYEKNNIEKLTQLNGLAFEEPVLGINISPEYIWIIQSYRIIELTKKRDHHRLISFSEKGRGDMPLINATYSDGLYNLLIGTSVGMYKYNARSKTINLYDSIYLGINNSIHSVIKDLRGRVWLSTNDGLIALDVNENNVKRFDINDGLSLQVYSDRLYAKAFDGRIVFCGRQEISLFNPDSLFKKGVPPLIKLIDVGLFREDKQETISLLSRDTLIVTANYRYLHINFAVLNLWAPKKNTFRYSLEKTNKPEKWNNLENKNSLILSNLPAGYYRLQVQGANSNGDWSNKNDELVIRIVAPLWQTPFAYVFYIILGLLILYSTVIIRTKHLLKQNREYKERDIISRKIEHQKEELSIKNKSITDSINYARRIQMALMPSQKVFTKYFPDSFILHIPKDIVSGDFYWINEVNNRIFFAAVDCTGHGVPGAFMSIIGFELLRRITEIEMVKQPADILNDLSRGFETIFRDVENITLRDGMDIAFCAIDKEKNILEFSGAFNPLYLIRNNTIIEIKGDRFSVGLHNDAEEELNTFKNHTVPLLEGDTLYIFTDGLADQFGGPEGKKYKYRRFRHLILALHNMPMDQQLEFLRKSINDWRGELEQVDDILVMGIHISQKST